MTRTLGRTIVAGLTATVAMTLFIAMAPRMGMPEMNIAAMLASKMGGVLALGWAAHFMIGSVLAMVYAFVFLPRLPGPGLIRGALFGLAPWLVAQLMVMPMMGMGLFSGSMAMAAGSLMGHLVYGTVLGGIVGTCVCSTSAA